MLFTDLSVKRERDTKMKKIVLFLSLGLVCVLAIPAFAADYTVAPPTQALFGTPTSVDVVTVGNNINRTAVDISKNSALIPPAFGNTAGSCINKRNHRTALGYGNKYGSELIRNKR